MSEQPARCRHAGDAGHVASSRPTCPGDCAADRHRRGCGARRQAGRRSRGGSGAGWPKAVIGRRAGGVARCLGRNAPRAREGDRLPQRLEKLLGRDYEIITADDRLDKLARRHRDRHLLPASSKRGVPEVPAQDRPRNATRIAPAPDSGQLRDTQAPQCEEVA